MAVHIAPIVFPGVWLAADRDDASKLTGLLSMLEGELANAAMALNMFEEVRTHRGPGMRETWEAHENRRREIEEAIAESRGGHWSDREAIDQIKVEAELAFLSELAEAGILPSAYQHQIPFMHAKSFLFALDSIRKAFLTFGRFSMVRDASDTALADLSKSLPDLAGVRDSTAHSDERSIGEARKKPITALPIKNRYIHAPDGGATVISGLMNDTFTCTLDSGALGSVDITEASLRSAQNVVQSFLDALPWRDPKFRRVAPIA